MTSPASNDDVEDSRSASFPLPRHLTPQARDRFVDAVREYAETLRDGVEASAARRSWAVRPEYNCDDVDAARRDSGRLPRGLRPDAAVQALSTALATVGTVGTSVMAGFLHSGWQVAVFVALIVLGVVGLAVPWTNRGR